MELPCRKIAVYLLTIIIYTHSGHSFDIFSNLRDVVLSAETIFGDVVRNVLSVAQKFKNINEVLDAAVEEDCIFKCPIEGTQPRLNHNYVPNANGCGSLGLQINAQYLPVGEMSKCCDEHDICYDTCNSNKEDCDKAFKTCLYKYCDNHKKQLGETMVKACKGAARLLYTGTLTLGCKSYIDAQTKACYCPTYGWKQEYTTKNSKKGARGTGEL